MFLAFWWDCSPESTNKLENYLRALEGYQEEAKFPLKRRHDGIRIVSSVAEKAHHSRSSATSPRVQLYIVERAFVDM